MIGKISILLPTFNCEKYILNAIQSILCQTYEYFELLVIDDGSTDNTSNLVKMVKDTRVQYVKIKHGGISRALNFGLKIANHDWIARMDADDLSLPNRLERQINFISNNSSYNIISSWYATFNNKGLYHLFKLPMEHRDIVQGLELHSSLCHAATIYHKQLILSVGGYSNCSFEDYDLWLKLKDKAMFYNIPEPLLLVRLRTQSLYRRDLKFNKKKIISLQRKYFEINHYKTFSKIDFDKKQKLEGWREWFYGDKNNARNVWSVNFLILLSDFRILIAFLLTYLPDKCFENIKDLKIKARINKYLALNGQNRKKIRNYLSYFLIL